VADDGGDLFASAAREQLQARAPLAARMRPTSLDDIVGQSHILGPGKPLRVLIERDRLTSAIIWGPAGTGKTTLANVIARATSKAFVSLSAVTATVKDVRETVAVAQERLGQYGQGTILFLDEVHRFNKAQQDALLPAVESGVLVLIGATTENPFFEVNPPLLSRSTLFRLEPLDHEAIGELLRRGLAVEGASITDEAMAHLVNIANGDGRHALTTLEVAIALAAARAAHQGGEAVVELADAEAAAGAKSLRYGEDEHYDVISAFIKSIRGSDVDAGLYWLARMLEAGEDARFIARRLVILASEDIGMADSMSLVVADAAARAVEFVGLPEAQLNLAHAVVHLATAPKSNRSYLALSRAQEAARRTRGAGLVPMHLRDAHYRGAAKLGHGKGYQYPHDDPTGWVEQNYRPAEVADDIYYEPSEHGREAVIAERMAARRRANSEGDAS
jgi:putative ATPase